MESATPCHCDSSDPSDPTEYLENLKKKYLNRTAKLQAQQQELERKITQMEMFIGKSGESVSPSKMSKCLCDESTVPRVFAETPVRDVPVLPATMTNVIQNQEPVSQQCSFFQKIMENAKSYLSMKCQCPVTPNTISPDSATTDTADNAETTTTANLSSSEPPTKETDRSVQENVVDYENSLTDKSSRTSTCTCELSDPSTLQEVSCSCNIINSKNKEQKQQSQQVSMEPSSSTKDTKNTNEDPMTTSVSKSDKCPWNDTKSSELMSGECSCEICKCDSSSLLEDKPIEELENIAINRALPEQVIIPPVSVFSEKANVDAPIQAIPSVESKGIVSQLPKDTISKCVTCCKNPSCRSKGKYGNNASVQVVSHTKNRGVNIEISRDLTNKGVSCCNIESCPSKRHEIACKGPCNIVDFQNKTAGSDRDNIIQDQVCQASCNDENQKNYQDGQNQCAFIGSPLLNSTALRSAASSKIPRGAPCDCNTSTGPKRTCDFSGLSLTSNDIKEMQLITELAKKEKEMKSQIAELQKREKQYQEATMNINNLVTKTNNPCCCCQGNNASGKMDNEIEKITRKLCLENQILKSELIDMKLELKHCIEKIEGPMKQKLEAEKMKCEHLQKELEDASKHMLSNQDTYSREMNQLKLQLCCACTNISELNQMNQRLKDEMSQLDCLCQKLEDDLIRQKVNEAETIKRLTNKKYVGDAPTTEKSEEFRCESNLDVIARKLSKTLKEFAPCDECSKLPAELAGAAKCIKDLTDMVRKQRMKTSTTTSGCNCRSPSRPQSKTLYEEDQEGGCCTCCGPSDGAGEATKKKVESKYVKTIHPVPESFVEKGVSSKFDVPGVQSNYYSAKGDLPCAKIGTPCVKSKGTIIKSGDLSKTDERQLSYSDLGTSSISGKSTQKDQPIQVTPKKDKICKASCSDLMEPVKDQAVQEDLLPDVGKDEPDKAKKMSTTSSERQYLSALAHGIVDQLSDVTKEAVEEKLVEKKEVVGDQLTALSEVPESQLTETTHDTSPVGDFTSNPETQALIPEEFMSEPEEDRSGQGLKELPQDAPVSEKELSPIGIISSSVPAPVLKVEPAESTDEYFEVPVAELRNTPIDMMEADHEAPDLDESVEADNIRPKTADDISFGEREIPLEEKRWGGDFPLEVGNRGFAIDEPPPDLHMTTTVVGSGTLEVVTEGPEGTIETTLIYTSDGNIEVITEMVDKFEDNMVPIEQTMEKFTTQPTDKVPCIPSATCHSMEEVSGSVICDETKLCHDAERLEQVKAMPVVSSIISGPSGPETETPYTLSQATTEGELTSHLDSASSGVKPDFIKIPEFYSDEPPSTMDGMQIDLRSDKVSAPKQMSSEDGSRQKSADGLEASVQDTTGQSVEKVNSNKDHDMSERASREPTGNKDSAQVLRTDKPILDGEKLAAEDDSTQGFKKTASKVSDRLSEPVGVHGDSKLTVDTAGVGRDGPTSKPTSKPTSVSSGPEGFTQTGIISEQPIEPIEGVKSTPLASVQSGPVDVIQLTTSSAGEKIASKQSSAMSGPKESAISRLISEQPLDVNESGDLAIAEATPPEREPVVKQPFAIAGSKVSAISGVISSQPIEPSGSAKLITEGGESTTTGEEMPIEAVESTAGMELKPSEKSEKSVVGMEGEGEVIKEQESEAGDVTLEEVCPPVTAPVASRTTRDCGCQSKNQTDQSCQCCECKTIGISTSGDKETITEKSKTMGHTSPEAADTTKTDTDSEFITISETTDDALPQSPSIKEAERSADKSGAISVGSSQLQQSKDWEILLDEAMYAKHPDLRGKTPGQQEKMLMDLGYVTSKFKISKQGQYKDNEYESSGLQPDVMNNVDMDENRSPEYRESLQKLHQNLVGKSKEEQITMANSLGLTVPEVIEVTDELLTRHPQLANLSMPQKQEALKKLGYQQSKIREITNVKNSSVEKYSGSEIDNSQERQQTLKELDHGKSSQIGDPVDDKKHADRKSDPGTIVDKNLTEKPSELTRSASGKEIPSHMSKPKISKQLSNIHSKLVDKHSEEQAKILDPLEHKTLETSRTNTLPITTDKIPSIPVDRQVLKDNLDLGATSSEKQRKILQTSELSVPEQKSGVLSKTQSVLRNKENVESVNKIISEKTQQESVRVISAILESHPELANKPFEQQKSILEKMGYILEDVLERVDLETSGTDVDKFKISTFSTPQLSVEDVTVSCKASCRTAANPKISKQLLSKHSELTDEHYDEERKMLDPLGHKTQKTSQEKALPITNEYNVDIGTKSSERQRKILQNSELSVPEQKSDVLSRTRSMLRNKERDEPVNRNITDRIQRESVRVNPAILQSHPEIANEPLEQQKSILEKMGYILEDILERADLETSGTNIDKSKTSTFSTPQLSLKDVSAPCKASCRTSAVPSSITRKPSEKKSVIVKASSKAMAKVKISTDKLNNSPSSREVSVSCKASCKSASTLHTATPKDSVIQVVDISSIHDCASRSVSLQKRPSSRDDSASCKASYRTISVQSSKIKQAHSRKEVRELVPARSDTTTTSSSSVPRRQDEMKNKEKIKKRPGEVPSIVSQLSDKERPAIESTKKPKSSRKKRTRVIDCMKCTCRDSCICAVCINDQKEKLRRPVRSCDCPPMVVMPPMMMVPPMQLSYSMPPTGHAANCRCNACVYRKSAPCRRDLNRPPEAEAPTSDETDDHSKKLNKHPSSCECIDCLCMPKVRELAATKEYPVVYDKKQIYQVKVKCDTCPSAQARKNQDSRSRIPISTSTPNPPKAKSDQKPLEPEATEQIESSSVPPAGAAPLSSSNSTYNSVACDCPQCVCVNCPDESKRPPPKKVSELAAPPPAGDRNCCCKGALCTCDPCTVEDLAKKLREAERRLLENIPVAQSEPGNAMLPQGGPDGECNCVECTCPRSDLVTKKAAHEPATDAIEAPTSEPGKPNQPDGDEECFCVECVCPGSANVTPKTPQISEGTPPPAQSDQPRGDGREHPADCDCAECVCPGIDDLGKNAIEKQTSVLKPPTQPAVGAGDEQCNCTICECPGSTNLSPQSPEAVTTGAGQSDQTTSPSTVIEACDCKDCKCSPCADPNRQPQKTPVAQTTSVMKGIPDCDCAECKCQPCADPKKQQTSAIDTKEDQIKEAQHDENCDCDECQCLVGDGPQVGQEQSQGDAQQPVTEDHGDDCDCPTCSCPTATSKMQTISSKTKDMPEKATHPPDCICSECLCLEEVIPTEQAPLEEVMQTDIVPKVEAGIQPATETEVHALNCACPECLCPECSTKATHSPTCKCAECVCTPCDKMDGQKVSSIIKQAANQQSVLPTGADCTCIKCACDVCNDMSKRKLDEAKDVPISAAPHGDGCKCIDCICKECLTTLASLKHEEGCQCAQCVCVECLKKIQKTEQPAETAVSTAVPPTSAEGQNERGDNCICDRCICIDCKGIMKDGAAQPPAPSTLTSTPSAEPQAGGDKKIEGKQDDKGDQCSCPVCSCGPCRAKNPQPDDQCNCPDCTCLTCTKIKKESVMKSELQNIQVEASPTKQSPDVENCTCANCQCKPCFKKNIPPEDCNCKVCTCVTCSKIRKEGAAVEISGVPVEKKLEEDHSDLCNCSVCQCPVQVDIAVNQAEKGEGNLEGMAAQQPTTNLQAVPVSQSTTVAEGAVEQKIKEEYSDICDCAVCQCGITGQEDTQVGQTEKPGQSATPGPTTTAGQAALLDPPPFEPFKRVECDCKNCNCVICSEIGYKERTVASGQSRPWFPDDYVPPAFEIPVRINCICERCSCVFCNKEVPQQKSVAAQPSRGLTSAPIQQSVAAQPSRDLAAAPVQELFTAQPQQDVNTAIVQASVTAEVPGGVIGAFVQGSVTTQTPGVLTGVPAQGSVAAQPSLGQAGVPVQGSVAAQPSLGQTGVPVQGSVAAQPSLGQTGVPVQRSVAAQPSLGQAGVPVQGSVAAQPSLGQTGVTVQGSVAAQPSLGQAGVPVQGSVAAQPYLGQAGVPVQGSVAAQPSLGQAGVPAQGSVAAQPSLGQAGVPVQGSVAAQPSLGQAGVPAQGSAAAQPSGGVAEASVHGSVIVAASGGLAAATVQGSAIAQASGGLDQAPAQRSVTVQPSEFIREVPAQGSVAVQPSENLTQVPAQGSVAVQPSGNLTQASIQGSVVVQSSQGASEGVTVAIVEGSVVAQAPEGPIAEPVQGSVMRGPSGPVTSVPVQGSVIRGPSGAVTTELAQGSVIRGPSGTVATEPVQGSVIRGPSEAVTTELAPGSIIRGPSGAVPTAPVQGSVIRGPSGAVTTEPVQGSVIRGPSGAVATEPVQGSVIRGPSGAVPTAPVQGSVIRGPSGAVTTGPSQETCIAQLSVGITAAPIQKSVGAEPSKGFIAGSLQIKAISLQSSATAPHPPNCSCEPCMKSVLKTTSSKQVDKKQSQLPVTKSLQFKKPIEVGSQKPSQLVAVMPFEGQPLPQEAESFVSAKISKTVEVIKPASLTQRHESMPIHCNCPTCTCDEGIMQSTTLSRSNPTSQSGTVPGSTLTSGRGTVRGTTSTAEPTTSGPTSISGPMSGTASANGPRTGGPYQSDETVILPKPDLRQFFNEHHDGCDCALCKCKPCADPQAVQIGKPSVKAMDNITLVKSIQAANKENCECKEQIEEIKRTLEKIRCACNEAEFRSTQSIAQTMGKDVLSSSGKPFVKQASTFGQTMSGLKMALNNLQAKCKAKDKMIEAMTTELNERGTPEVFDKVLNLSAAIPVALDYDQAEDVKSLDRSQLATNVIYPPTEVKDEGTTPCNIRCVASKGVEVRTHKHKKKTEKSSAKSGKKTRDDDCTCSTPQIIQKDEKECQKLDLAGFEVVDIRRITEDSLIVKWNAPNNDQVQGYDIFVNGTLASRVMSGTRTSAMMHSLDLSKSAQITIYAVTRCGRVEPPAIAIYEIKS